MTLLESLNWLGTLTFAATGALVGVRKGFDLIGVLVLAAVTAVGGGSLRDVMVGILPTTSLQSENLLWGVTLIGIAVFYGHGFIRAEGRLLYALDTLGLGLFAALGAERGIGIGLGFWGTVFCGAISGVGGGIIRDLLSGQIPGILYRSGDFYASAAGVGAAVTFFVHGIDPELSLVAGASATILMRLGSRLFGLKLPVPRSDAA